MMLLFLNWARFVEETAVVYLLWRACRSLGKLLRQANDDREARELAIQDLTANTKKLAQQTDELSQAKILSDGATAAVVVDTIQSATDSAAGRVVDAIKTAAKRS